MSRVKNEPKIKNKLIVAIREQLEHRALWLYLLCDEAKKEGIAPTSFARKAISRCGDHGIGKMYDSRLELPKCIAKGDDICALRYMKNKKEE